MRNLALRAVTICILIFCVAAPAHSASINEDEAGQVIALVDNKQVSLPMLKSDYDVTIDGTLATVTLKQTFLNTYGRPVNATYLFPLNQKAAVYAMTMKLGDETVQAVIQRKEEAKRSFEAAKAEGKAASLLVQHRPNMFTQDIANLMPDAPLTVTLKYVQHVPKTEGAYELVVPLVVGPRYEGAVPVAVAERIGRARYQEVESAPLEPTENGETETVSGWTIAKLPAYPPVFGQDAPGEIDRERVSFNLTLKSPLPISGIYSTTHPLVIDLDQQSARATFTDGRAIGNKDLVLRYELGSDSSVSAGGLSHFDERGGFVSLQIEPPKMPAEDMVTPRELVFVLDTSGSMSGKPMDASKTFMRAALKGLRPEDHFRILRFSNNTSQFSNAALRATPSNVRAGTRFIDSLSAAGGTEMNNAMNTAFDLLPVGSTMRIVVFLTDGYIGADRQVIQTVARRAGNARIHAFGIGQAVNRYLLEGMAKEGRGRVRYIEAGESAFETAEAFARSLGAPILTDIEIDWNGLDVTGQSPARVPDLFAGGAVNVLARYQHGGEHQIIVNGLVNGRKASMPVDLRLAETPHEGEASNDSALPVVWAREQVFDLERTYTISGGSDDRLKEWITKLGLDFSLQTAFTSFVAVSEEIYNQSPGRNAHTSVAVPQVSGVRRSAYPSLNFSGSSTPEPEAFLGLIAALMLVLMRFRKAVSGALGALTIRWRMLKARLGVLHNKSLPSCPISGG